MEAADDQLREIKKLRREESKSFKRKGNEIQYKFNLKLQDTLDEVKSDLESTAVYKAKSSLSEDVFSSGVWASLADLREPSLTGLVSRLQSTVIASRKLQEPLTLTEGPLRDGRILLLP